MDNWNEIRTAYQVARLGTVSAAADALGLHRATVIRHIDALEGALGEKLFLRHAKGYAPTPAGQELMAVAQATEDQFDQLASRIKAQAQIQSGEIVLTSLPVVANVLMPALRAFRTRHPGVRLRHLASARTLKLEKGEAHIAIRTATEREEPDNVVQRLTTFQLGLFGSQDYIERRGAPGRLEDLRDHDFVALDVSEAIISARLYHDWITDLGVRDRIVFGTTNLSVVNEAISAGLGLGFFPVFSAQTRSDLAHVLPEAVTREGALSVVTHVDFHRTPRIQSFLQILRETVPPSL